MHVPRQRLQQLLLVLLGHTHLQAVLFALIARLVERALLLLPLMVAIPLVHPVAFQLAEQLHAHLALLVGCAQQLMGILMLSAQAVIILLARRLLVLPALPDMLVLQQRQQRQ